MPKFIYQNPFRVFGVYSNTSLRELTANKTRISAYAKVGKCVTFALDGVSCIPEVLRTQEAIQNADHELNMPLTKLVHAMSWFVNGSSLDEMAIGHYLAGNSEKAKELLQKRPSSTSHVNLSVINFIEGNYGNALQSAYAIVNDHEMCKSFVALICGETFVIDPHDLWKAYIDLVVRDIKASSLLIGITSQHNIDTSYIKNIALEEPLQLLNSLLSNVSDQLKNSSPAVAYKLGIQLMKTAKLHLPKVQSLIGKHDVRYISIADSLANMILQCGINYYNSTDDDDDVDKAMVLQEYACSIAAGSLVVQRCQKNLNILKSKKDEGAAAADIAFVIKSLEELQRKYKSISTARAFVNSCKPRLDAIAAQLGVTNELFVKISTAVANNALGVLVSAINEAQGNSVAIVDGTLKSKIDDALSVMSTIGSLTMTQQERHRFNENKATLSNMRDQVMAIANKIKERNSSNGCYIATMVYGDYDHPQVLVLRDFRDNVLRKSALGRAFIKFYYRYSPTWVKHLKNCKKINSFIRIVLDKFIKVYKYEKN